MLTQAVMLATIFFLCFCGVYFFRKRRETKIASLGIFSAGLFLIAFAVLFYAIRDIFVQFKMYEIQKNLLVVGGFLHIIGAYLILWFLVKEFGPKGYFRYFYYFLFGILLLGFGFFLTGRFFKIGSEIQQAPLEPIKYYVVRNYIEDYYGNIILWSAVILISALVILIISLNLLKERKNKAIFKKGLFYGSGIWFLVAPMIICATISPVFARIGYLVGSILIYKTIKLKT